MIAAALGGMIAPALLYLLVPLPLGLAWFRARFEKQGYAETIRASVEVYGGHFVRRPEVRAHVVAQFVTGEVDVLVSTMIVESGLDVPNANTMVVHDAHRFGLAQLYQLRGRVGRSHRRAYCYLVVPDVIDDDAEERLKVLEFNRDNLRSEAAEARQRSAKHEAEIETMRRALPERTAPIVGLLLGSALLLGIFIWIGERWTVQGWLGAPAWPAGAPPTRVPVRRSRA